jgi:hypothetical protein
LFDWMNRHWIVTWSLAWGVAVTGLTTSDVWSNPRNGPLWAAVVPGVVAWSIAGAGTLGRSRPVAGLATWAASYLLALQLGSLWGAWMVEHRVASGFKGALYGWAVAGGAAAFTSAVVAGWDWNPARPILFGAIWAVGFFVAGYATFIVGYLLGVFIPGWLLPALPFLAGASGGAASGALGLWAWGILIERSNGATELRLAR